ncbi:MAG: hypothetical protein AcusKO_05390 [Acuticoccus sp.]
MPNGATTVGREASGRDQLGLVVDGGQAKNRFAGKERARVRLEGQRHGRARTGECSSDQDALVAAMHAVEIADRDCSAGQRGRNVGEGDGGRHAHQARLAM